ncbi:MAG: hypothetical protein M5R36_16565 [Deltaproteobacteria bacterium]|nr:hypothetical protein [Deltaproteobacteria bacterium]
MPRTSTSRPGLFFRSYRWPGNVRELENIVQRLLVTQESDMIRPAHLPSYMRAAVHARAGLKKTLGEVEAEHIRRVVESQRGNRTRAAEILGIDRKTLREKLKKYGIVTTG